ncbi:hypothetical protein PAPHI01_0474 [Pancytospora philotis]|nr:hypothetical protein PAPHI01_0474 [Pancytospora philotis]
MGNDPEDADHKVKKGGAHEQTEAAAHAETPSGIRNADADDADKEDSSSVSSFSRHTDMVSYESLSSIEKDVLKNRLRGEILNDMQEAEHCCFSFCNWICEQFRIEESAGVVSATVYSNLDMLERSAGTHDLFVSPGVFGKVDDYYKKTLDGEEIDYDDADLDIYSLAIATLQVLKDQALFFDNMLYQRMSDAWRSEEEREWVAARLPFVMNNRDAFISIISLVAAMDAAKASNGVERDTLLGVLSSYLIVWDLENVADPMDEAMKRAVLSDLLAADFTYVSMQFYQN